jgi:hypothetical protein
LVKILDNDQKKCYNYSRYIIIFIYFILFLLIYWENMQNKNKKEMIAADRPADNIIKKTELKIGAMALISNAQIKLWKALLFSCFFAGFIGALAYTVAYDEGLKTNATWSIRNAVNVAALSEVTSSSYTRNGYGPEKMIDENGQINGMTVMRLGGEPWLKFDLPGNQAQKIVKLSLKLDPTKDPYRLCGLHDFTVQASLDGKNFNTVLTAVKNNTVGWEEYLINDGHGVEAQFLKLIVDSNWGDPAWVCVQEMKLAAI